MRVILPTPAEASEDELKQAVVEAYNDLFEELNTNYGTFFQTLNPPLTVKNIVTFYRGIRAIIDGGQNLPHNKFFRLPLDEPPFVINMDTRVITVPSVFQTNGFGVKGDANAEIVFFECDRYYDGVDLGAMIPGLLADGDPSKCNCVVQWQNVVSNEAGNSSVILADILDDKLIFGWMITAKMTSRPGTIRFAVRWTQLKDDEIVYSISTQEASCQVKSTIDLDYDTLGIDSVEDIIYTRPFYSGIINSMAGSSPQVTKGLSTATRNLEAIDPEDTEMAAEYPVATYPDGVLKLEVAATSPDGKPIVFQWFNGDSIINGATEDTYIVTAPGHYYVKIGNDGTADGVGIRYVTSESITVPAPDQIKFDSTNWFGSGTYSDGDAGHKPTVLVVNDKGNTPNGTVVYTWKKANMLKVVDDVTTVVPVAELTDASYEVVNGANEASYQPPVGTEAYYKCEVVNKLNNTSSNIIKTADPAVIRAVPAAPIGVNIEFDQANQVLKVISINWGDAPAKYHPDEIRYEWGSLADGTYSNSIGYGDRYKNFSVAGLTLKNGQTWSSDFYCRVQHVVYRNNNGGQEKQSGLTTSGLVTLNIRVDANNQVTVVAAE